MIAIVTVIVLIIFLVLVLAVHLSLGTKKIYNNLNNKHVVITGGSSGIGKAAAVEAAKLGANVTLIGRDVTKLETAANEIRKACLVPEKQEVQYAILDVTAGFEAVQKCFSGLEASVGPIFMLINCAGMCICGEFENMKAEDIKYMIDLNYFGTAYPTKYVLPGMKKKNEGLIVFVSTEAALLGIYGFSAYGGAKWAVRGLAETLFMELEGTGVQLTLAFPPDTDTPGFQEEQKTKPKETKLMCESGGLKTAEEVARKMIQDVLVM